MLDSSDVQRSRQRAWLTATLLCAALLFLPAIAWILAPRPGGFAAPPAPPQVRVALAPTFEPKPAAPARAPTPKPNAEPAPSGPVEGTVLDPDGKPVKGAFVGCDDRDRTLSTTTDAEGHFKLPGEASGCLAVSHHPDFTPAERIEISAGKRNVIHLRSQGGIAGSVVDEKNNPLSPYLLAIESFQGTGEAAEGIPPTGQARSIADMKGAFLWEALAPGKYVLTASADGRPPTRSASIDVEAGRITRGIRIVLPRGAVLSGKIVDASTRKPIGGAVVALDAMTTTNANAILPSHTDDSGRYSLDGVPPGPFSIRVAHANYRTLIVPGLTSHGSAPVKHDVELQLRGDGGADNEMAGVGAVLIPQPKGVMISWLLDGGPAASAGLRTNDMISRIDGVDAQNLTMSDCIQRLRGPEGSRVSVTVAREGEGMIEVMITRKTIVR